MKEQTILSLFGIGAIVILEAIALLKGVNGAMLMTSLALIGGIAGYEIKSLQSR